MTSKPKENSNSQVLPNPLLTKGRIGRPGNLFPKKNHHSQTLFSLICLLFLQEQIRKVNGCPAVRKSCALFPSPARWKSHLHTVQTNAGGGGGWFSLLIFLPRVGNDFSKLIRPDRCSHRSARTLHLCWPIGVMVWKADLLIILSDGCCLL